MDTAGLMLAGDMIAEYLRNPSEEAAKELSEWLAILSTEFKLSKMRIH